MKMRLALLHILIATPHPSSLQVSNPLLGRCVEVIRGEGSSALVAVPLRPRRSPTPLGSVRPDQKAFGHDRSPANRTVV
jgi:hypothetical protein